MPNVVACLRSLEMRQYFLALLFAATAWPAAADDAVTPEPLVIGLPGAGGSFRGRTQLMYDPTAQALVRRWVQVWDSHPDQNRVFTWTPERIPPAGAPAEGKGQLTWREAGAPSYDPDAVASVYRGALWKGQPDGYGTETDRNGTSYAGQWHNGHPEGRGQLRLSDGAEYDGALHLGMAEGRGRFVDIDGEVFEGSFRRGLREGFATTILPNRARYQSRWRAGIEDAASRRVRMAQASAGGAALGQDLRIGLSVLQKPVQDFPLHYTSKSSGELLEVFPDNERLMSLWKGAGELQVNHLVSLDPQRAATTWTIGSTEGVFDLARGDLAPLQVTLEVQNRSAYPVQIVGAYLKVAASSTDYQPAVQLSSAGHACSPVGYSTNFELQNLGWGPVEHPLVRFDFQLAGASQRFSGNQRKTFDSFEKVSDVEFDPDLKSAGVDIASLKRYASSGKGYLPCSEPDREVCISELKNSGIFGRLASDVLLAGDQLLLGMKGVLDYEWRDSFGSYHQRESPFTEELVLGRLPETSECGEGAEDLPVAVNPVELQLDKANYKLPLVFERSLPPGRTARYSFALTAAKASEHRFTVVLQLADGREITSRPVNLTYFVPNWKPPS